MAVIALAGNPNSGKTTLFNALTGSNQYVGNWPGVTVEKKEGRLRGSRQITVTDLPGVYSLSPYTLEEVVTRHYLLNERPDAVLNIIDGSNIERNLYLTAQLLELGIPVLVAVNMLDVLEKDGDTLDLGEFSRQLGCPVAAISALKGTGIAALARQLPSLPRQKPPAPWNRFPPAAEETLAALTRKLGKPETKPAVPARLRRFCAVKLLERDALLCQTYPALAEEMEPEIRATEAALEDDSDSAVSAARYDAISALLRVCLVRKKTREVTPSDRIDRLLTHRVLALPLFAAIMFLVYYISVSTAGKWMSDWVKDGLFGDGFVLFGHWVRGIPALLEGLFARMRVAPWLQGLVLKGMLSGVGSVLSFVPQMIVLFFFLAFLEACGYMSRIAFILDRLFRRFGLSGKSFIPILIGTGCGVPGIMASRTIENERDRRMTVITTTFIPCSAKLPIIALISGALFGGAWWVAPSAYFAGIAAIVCSGLLLKKWKLFAGKPSPFVMELPAYHLPTLRNLLRSVWERTWSFLKKAGTIILLSCVLDWFLSNFSAAGGRLHMVEEMGQSLLAAAGRRIDWIFAPLGFGTWQATVSTLMGLVAKENLAGTLGVLYGGSGNLWANLTAAFQPLSAYAFLLFNLLCAPCFAAVGAIRREMNSSRWTLFALGYQTCFAYTIALIVYQFGLFFGGHGFRAATAAALLAFLGLAWLLIRPERGQANADLAGERRRRPARRTSRKL
ncbi:MAG: ferrous iron transport protein B [Oscillospiraceae bacterium]|jgi:ferrous iron transport protein B|nr:ferrous iron transport protein B [Oscillospiraceae bacterium]